MTALDLIYPASIDVPASDAISVLPGTATPPVAPHDAIPVQAGPALTVSLLHGCELPLEALKTGRAVACHPCDEAVVRLLVARVRHHIELLVCATVAPGSLRFD